MVREINGLGGLPSGISTTDKGGKKPSEAANNVATNTSQSGTTDDVQLSSEAKTLQSLSDKVKDLPEVNIERAEKIKAALENGEYKIDDLVLADKIVNAENLLGS